MCYDPSDVEKPLGLFYVVLDAHPDEFAHLGAEVDLGARPADLLESGGQGTRYENYVLIPRRFTSHLFN